MNRLKELESIRNTFEEALAKVVQQIEAEKICLVQETLPIDGYHLAFCCCHLCAKSPTGCCVYNDATDPAHDNCVYCGLPEDRG